MRIFTFLIAFLVFALVGAKAQNQPVLPLDFESANTTYTFTDFDGGALTKIANPQSNGINTSANVAKMVKSAGQPWGGSYVSLAAPIDFSTNKTFKVKVFMPKVGAKLLLKVENLTDAAVNYEKEATGTVANAWEELTFDYSAINTTKQYQKVVFIFDLGTMGDGGANFTYLLDDLRLVSGGGGPVLTQMNLPVTFDDATVEYGLIGFGGADASTIVTDPTNANNKVAKVIKSATAELWAGTTVSVASGAGFSSKIPFTATDKKMSVRVWSPHSGIKVRLKVEDSADNTKSVETEATSTVANDWETLTFDFANQAAGTAAINLATNYNKASIFFNFGVTGATAGEKTYYFDDMKFVTAGGGGGSTEPTTAATTPTRPSGNVISLFSNAYTNVPVNTWRTDWSQATLTETQVAGNDVKKYTSLNFVGVETTGANMINASSMLYFHVDAWTPNITAFRIKLVDFGADGAFAGGDDKEHELSFTPTLNGWNSYEIPLSNFTNLTTKGHIAQLIFSGDPSGSGTVYIDNVYFHNISGGGGPVLTQMNLPVTFDDATVEYGLIGFGGADASTIVTDPTNANNKVAKVIKSATAEVWAGTTVSVASGAGFSSKIPFTATDKKMSVRVWSPHSGIKVRLKVEDSADNTKSVETEATSTVANDWETLTFDFANQAAGTAAINLATNYNKASIFFNFGVTGATAGEKTYYFDDMKFVAAGGGGGLTQMNLPVTFDDVTVEYGLIGFGGADASTIVTDPTNANNKVAKVIKSAVAELWAGTTVTNANGAGFSAKIPFTANEKKMNVRVWSPHSGIKIRLKVEDSADNTKSVETEATSTIANNWETLTFDFSNQAAGTAAINLAFNYNKASIFFNFGVTGATAGERTYYFDDVKFGAGSATPANQTINFPTITDKTVGDAAFNLTATASSGLAVAYSTTSDKVTINASSVTIVKAGRVVIKANQAGNASFNAAPEVTQSFCIKPTKPTITTSGLNTETVTLTSSSSTGNQWYLNGNVIANATNSTFTPTGPGTYKVQVKVDDCLSAFSNDTPLVVTGDLTTYVSVRVFPNPMDQYIEVSGVKGEVSESRMVDVTGRGNSIHLERSGEVLRADVGHLSTGVYVLQIQEGNTIHKLKVIKK